MITFKVPYEDQKLIFNKHSPFEPRERTRMRHGSERNPFTIHHEALPCLGTLGEFALPRYSLPNCPIMGLQILTFHLTGDLEEGRTYVLRDYPDHFPDILPYL